MGCVKKVLERVEKDLVTLNEKYFQEFGREAESEKFDKPMKVIAWYNLRQGLSEMLPKKCLKLGYDLQDLVQVDNGKLHFLSLQLPENYSTVQVRVNVGHYCHQ